MAPTPIPWQQRFCFYFTPGAPDECWEWTGARDQRGYGRLNSGGKHGKPIKAHRASWAIHNDTEVPPPSVKIRHTCDNPPCVNPAHLLAGTQRDNGRDMATRGRSAAQRGHDNGRTKLSDEVVRAIRERAAAGEQHEAIAADYGCRSQWVSEVARGNRRLRAGGPLSAPRDHLTGRWAHR